MLYQFSRNALSFAPPIRLPGNIYIGGPEHGGRIDLKDALMPIVTYARVVATRHRVLPTHTLQRIAALVDLGVLSGSTGDEVTAAYDFLMGLRLQTQLAATKAGQPASSSVEVGRLGQSQEECSGRPSSRSRACNAGSSRNSRAPGSVQRPGTSSRPASGG